MKKIKWTNIAIWGGLAVLVLVVVITSIVLHAKHKEYEDLKNKNEVVKPEETDIYKKNKIFFKNFEIFIDKDLFF